MLFFSRSARGSRGKSPAGFAWSPADTSIGFVQGLVRLFRAERGCRQGTLTPTAAAKLPCVLSSPETSTLAFSHSKAHSAQGRKHEALCLPFADRWRVLPLFLLFSEDQILERRRRKLRNRRDISTNQTINPLQPRPCCQR